jgi:hypothetical protein
MNRRNRRSFRPSLDVLPSRITPSGIAFAPGPTLGAPVGPNQNIFLDRFVPSRSSLDSPPLNPADVSNPHEISVDGPLDPWFLNPDIPEFIQ